MGATKFETLVTTLIEQNAALLALLQDEAPAKGRKAPKAGKAPKAAAVVDDGSLGSGTALTKGSRKAFIAAAAKEGVEFPADEATGLGWSCRELAAYCVTEAWTPKGFRIGAGYVALVS